MFTSAVALKTFIAKTHQVSPDTLEYIELSKGEKMLISKADPSKPLGFATFTYMGMVPGRGKVWNIHARPA
jgi:hypothetical protein